MASISLTICPDPDDNRDIFAASNETPARTVCIAQKDVNKFIHTLSDFERAVHTQGLTQKVTIKTHDWQRWLRDYQIIEDDCF